MAKGHFWWRRYFNPVEVPHVWMHAPGGGFSDYLIRREDVDSMAAAWAKGRLGTFNGDELTIEWLDRKESMRVKHEDFGL